MWAHCSHCLRRMVSFVDCSKISNKADLLAIFGMVVIVVLLAFAVWLSYASNSFVSGFFSATIIWKWRDWIYVPIDKMIDKFWS